MGSPLKKKQKLGSIPYKSKLGQGIGLTSQSKELIIRFYNYLEMKMNDEFPNTAKVDVIIELKRATVLSEPTLYGIVNSGISGIKSPKKQEIEPQNIHLIHSINK